MKKTLIAILALAAVAACNKAEVVETNPGEAIAFGDAFVDNATKAQDNTYGSKDLSKFNVYGIVQSSAGKVNIFTGDEVTGSVGENAWSCDNKQYWIEGATYDFAAVVDAAVSEKDDHGMPVKLTANVKDDVLYAEQKGIVGKASGNGKVNFTFSHLFSKAQFTVSSTTEGGYYYDVVDIKVANFETATYTVADKMWSGTSPKEIEFGDVKKVTADDNNKTNATQMLLVPTTDDFQVSFTVNLYKDNVLLGTNEYTKPVSTDLLGGNAYNFNISLTVGELIEFTVTQNPTWAPATGGADVNL